ncbi:MAG: 1-acyl-sn-glycerol-3-phosphate acyltransferase, partial [Pseudomonadota bacterium]|nr:1-acyl-sn-glycerol-3-phosphate acyltransferase [Pseudomonadota bacterium]
MILLRSTLYFLWFVAVSVVVHIAALPALLMPPAVTLLAARIWCKLLLWGLKVIAGLDYEVRGTIPEGGALVAAKHMSMWDTLALYLLLHDARFVLKK